MAAQKISIDPDELTKALTILDNWGSGQGLPDSGSLLQHHGPSVGVTSEFHKNLVQSAAVFEKLATDIRTAMSTAHQAVSETVKDLTSTDTSSADAAKSLTTALTPVATQLHVGQPASGAPAAAPSAAAAPTSSPAASGGGGSASMDIE